MYARATTDFHKRPWFSNVAVQGEDPGQPPVDLYAHVRMFLSVWVVDPVTRARTRREVAVVRYHRELGSRDVPKCKQLRWDRPECVLKLVDTANIRRAVHIGDPDLSARTLSKSQPGQNKGAVVESKTAPGCVLQRSGCSLLGTALVFLAPIMGALASGSGRAARQHGLNGRDTDACLTEPFAGSGVPRGLVDANKLGRSMEKGVCKTATLSCAVAKPRSVLCLNVLKSPIRIATLPRPAINHKSQQPDGVWLPRVAQTGQRC
ncbi:hypothetical protein KFL_008630045 [Klebsormidium nitens]|uniref:Uncharacterized protein n=1 Tax=Klebsormidium nitens TaxID=105231 RepID=A0A1Y1IT46_KLENI|nr:hypothetical protein KFL_008630045 [Klebsormidium nitens]|eukprot:GAQ91827.1 hypothetical protein KFL_008630045 [Klebsormidium nitens]